VIFGGVDFLADQGNVAIDRNLAMTDKFFRLPPRANPLLRKEFLQTNVIALGVHGFILCIFTKSGNDKAFSLNHEFTRINTNNGRRRRIFNHSPTLTLRKITEDKDTDFIP